MKYKLLEFEDYTQSGDEIADQYMNWGPVWIGIRVMNEIVRRPMSKAEIHAEECRQLLSEVLDVAWSNIDGSQEEEREVCLSVEENF